MKGRGVTERKDQFWMSGERNCCSCSDEVISSRNLQVQSKERNEPESQ